MKTSSLLLYLAASACAYALFVQASYLGDYFGNSLNPYRHEYLGGILMVGLLSAAVWLPTLAFSVALARKDGLRTVLWIPPFTVSALVALLSVAAVVISVAA